MLYISDPCSQMEAKNVTYNAFRFSCVQQELSALHETLLAAERSSPDLLALVEVDYNYYLGLFGTPSIKSNEAV
jgi:hypothetical protein